MLKLPAKPIRTTSSEIKRSCEICQEPPPLHNAHWIDRQYNGSTKFYNILDLCPNCHTKLDSGNEDIYTKAQRILFYRSMKKLFVKHQHSEDEKKDLLLIAKQIINKKL